MARSARLAVTVILLGAVLAVMLSIGGEKTGF